MYTYIYICIIMCIYIYVSLCIYIYTCYILYFTIDMCVTIDLRIRSPLATKEILEFIIWVASSPSWFAMFDLDDGTEERIETKRSTGMHPTCASNLAIWPLLGRTKFLIHHPHKTPCYPDFEAAHMHSIVEMDIILQYFTLRCYHCVTRSLIQPQTILVSHSIKGSGYSSRHLSEIVACSHISYCSVLDHFNNQANTWV